MRDVQDQIAEAKRAEVEAQKRARLTPDENAVCERARVDLDDHLSPGLS